MSRKWNEIDPRTEAENEAPGTLVPADKVHEQILTLLLSWGMSEEQSRTSATVMVDTDLSGVDSHGLSMLMDYDQSRRKGKLNLHAAPHIVRENTVTALVDADAGLGHAAAVMGMELAIGRAKEHGVGIVTVRNSHHFGAAGYYARMASSAGLVGLVMSATRTINTVPTRGRMPVMGTNPIAFSAPARRNLPFTLDMATSSCAANKVKVYELRGHDIPSGWVVDEKAQPVTDSTQAMDILFRRPKDIGGGLTPVGGSAEMASHKGYGLAMMVHILAGTLSGSSFSPLRIKKQKPDDPDNLGHFFCAIDPTVFREPGEFEDDLDEVIDVLHDTPAADPDLPVLVPGDLEAQARERRRRRGIPVTDSLADKIKALCEQDHVPFLLR
jgi:LDH2 family malate/lactate/ureidoglycolate dehydrogenase